MQRAVLYTRVSSDDQVKGFSLDAQSDLLHQYCTAHTITPSKTFTDDGYSAKTFERPEWKKLTSYIKANHSSINQVLILRWDRFARNVEQALKMIREFKAFGIQINAIQQPLDYSSPEHKLLLNIYLTIPEVENDKLSIRTKEGMRQGIKQGYYVTSAPLGYSNCKNEDGKSTIAANNKAPIIQYIFEQFATGLYSQKELRVMVKRWHGHYVSRNNLQKILRNPTYIGKIRDKEGLIYEGIHLPLIDELTFYRVQDILEGRKPQRFYKSAQEDLPLRGHLLCPKCHAALTGSASTGKMKKKYWYYHCTSSCGVRYSAPAADAKFITFLSSLKPRPEVAACYKAILSEAYESEGISKENNLNKITKQMAAIEVQQSTAQDMLFAGKISDTIFNQANDRYSLQLEDLQIKYRQLNADSIDINNQINSTINLLNGLGAYYVAADLDTKSKIVSSIFPESLYFSDGYYRTQSMNEAIGLIYGLEATFTAKEAQKKGHILDVSPMVAPSDKISNSFMRDLNIINDLYLHLTRAA